MSRDATVLIPIITLKDTTLVGKKFFELFDITRPHISDDYASIVQFAKYAFQTEYKREDLKLILKGEMKPQDGSLVYLAHPHVTCIKDLAEQKMHFGSFQTHDAARDLILLGESQSSERGMAETLDTALADLAVQKAWHVLRRFTASP